MPPVRIIIADDHAVFRSGLRALLEKDASFDVVSEAGTGIDTIKQTEEIEFDVLLLDIKMPDITGIKVAEKLLNQKPDAAIVVLTMYDDEYYLQELFKIGVKGFVLKQSTGTSLVQAIRAVCRGDQFIDPSVVSYVISQYVGRPKTKESHRKALLTAREQEICSLLAYGHTNSEIARQINVSERTVESHRSHIFSKLELKSRADLVRYAIENGLMKSS